MATFDDVDANVEANVAADVAQFWEGVAHLLMSPF
jgi:hypothetical protein